MSFSESRLAVLAWPGCPLCPRWFSTALDGPGEPGTDLFLTWPHVRRTHQRVGVDHHPRGDPASLRNSQASRAGQSAKEFRKSIQEGSASEDSEPSSEETPDSWEERDESTARCVHCSLVTEGIPPHLGRGLHVVVGLRSRLAVVDVEESRGSQRPSVGDQPEPRISAGFPRSL